MGMKSILALLLICFLTSAQAATPSFTSFIGSNSVTIITNPSTGKIVISGGSSTSSVPQSMSVYNADVGLRKWFGKVGAASTSVVHVVVIGNSNAEGMGTTDTNKMSYVSIVREAMQERFGNAGYGIVPAYRGLSTSIRPSWNVIGSWASSGNSPGYSPFEQEKFATGTANIYEMDAFCDSVTLYGVLWNLGMRAGANSAYVNIDNGTLSNQVNSFVSSGRAYQNTNILTGALGMHNIKIYAPNTTSNIGLWGMSVNIGTRGVQVHNIGRNGTKVSDTSNTLSMASIAGIAGNGAAANAGPALTIIELTSNDYSTQAATNIFLAGVISMVNTVGSNGSVIVVGDLFRSGGLTIPQSVYHSMLRAAAFTNSTPFVFVDFLEYYAGQEATIGVSDDQTHFNNRGHQHVAQTLLSMTLPLGASPAVKKTSVTNNFALNVWYTNQESAAFISAVISMTNVLATDLSMVGLYLDQDGDGTFEKTGIKARLQGVIALAGAEELCAMIQPYSRFAFTNLSSGGTAAIEANSSQYFWSK